MKKEELEKMYLDLTRLVKEQLEKNITYAKLLGECVELINMIGNSAPVKELIDESAQLRDKIAAAVGEQPVPTPTIHIVVEFGATEPVKYASIDKIACENFCAEHDLDGKWTIESVKLGGL